MEWGRKRSLGRRWGPRDGSGLGAISWGEIGPGRSWAKGLLPREMGLRTRWACGGWWSSPKEKMILGTQGHGFGTIDKWEKNLWGSWGKARLWQASRKKRPGLQGVGIQPGLVNQGEPGKQRGLDN
jgi:hypothetical protein